MLRLINLQHSLRGHAVRLPARAALHKHAYRHNNVAAHVAITHQHSFATHAKANNTLSTLLQHATTQPEHATDLLQRAYNHSATNFNIIRNVLLQHKHLTPEQRQKVHAALHKQYTALTGNAEPASRPIQLDVSQLPYEIDYEYRAEQGMVEQLYAKLNAAIFGNTLNISRIEMVNTQHIKQLKHTYSVCPSHTHRSYLQVNVHDDGNVDTVLYVNTEAAVGFKQRCEILLHDMLHLYDLQQYAPYSDTYMHGYDGHTESYFQQCMELEEQLKAESANYIRVLRPSRPTGSLVPGGMDKIVYAELLHNMITELTLAERRQYQRTVKTGDIVRDLQQAGIEQSKIELITEPLFRPPPKEGEDEQVAGST